MSHYGNLNNGASVQHLPEEGGRYRAGCRDLLSNRSFVTFHSIAVSLLLLSSLVHSFLISVVGSGPCFSLQSRGRKNLICLNNYSFHVLHRALSAGSPLSD